MVTYLISLYHLLFSTGIQVVPQTLTLGTQAAPTSVSVETQTEISSFTESPMDSQCTVSQSGSEQSGGGTVQLIVIDLIKLSIVFYPNMILIVCYVYELIN